MKHIFFFHLYIYHKLYAMYSKIKVHKAMEDLYMSLVKYENEKDSLHLTKKIIKLDTYIKFCKEHNLYKKNNKILDGYENWSKISKYLLMALHDHEISPDVLKITENPTNLPESIGMVLHHMFSSRLSVENFGNINIVDKDMFFEKYIARKKEIIKIIDAFDFHPYWERIMKGLLELDSSFIASKIYPETFWMSFLEKVDSVEVRSYLCSKIKSNNKILIKYYDRDFLEKSRKILSKKMIVVVNGIVFSQ